MSQPLPLKDFRYLTEREMAVFDVTQMADDGNKGYIIEVRNSSTCKLTYWLKRVKITYVSDIIEARDKLINKYVAYRLKHVKTHFV